MVELSVRSPGAYHFGGAGGRVWGTWGSSRWGLNFSVRYIIYWCSVDIGLGPIAL